MVMYGKVGSAHLLNILEDVAQPSDVAIGTKAKVFLQNLGQEVSSRTVKKLTETDTLLRLQCIIPSARCKIRFCK